MPVINQKNWDAMVLENTDSYGRCCIVIAEKAFKLLDKQLNTDYNATKLLIKACKGKHIDSYQGGLVALLIKQFHNKGAEFTEKWNKENEIVQEN